MTIRMDVTLSQVIGDLKLRIVAMEPFLKADSSLWAGWEGEEVVSWHHICTTFVFLEYLPGTSRQSLDGAVERSKTFRSQGVLKRTMESPENKSLIPVDFFCESLY